MAVKADGIAALAGRRREPRTAASPRRIGFLHSRSRSIPADAEAVFEVVADLGDMAWLPPGVETELAGPRLLRLWFGDHDVDMPVMIDWRSLCISWGDGDASCSGWLRVSSLDDNTSVVSVHLRGPRGVPEARVSAWTDNALEALAFEVRAEPTRA